jgi:hypothetical protein
LLLLLFWLAGWLVVCGLLLELQFFPFGFRFFVVFFGFWFWVLGVFFSYRSELLLVACNLQWWMEVLVLCL